jgi:hypothetical protein
MNRENVVYPYTGILLLEYEKGRTLGPMLHMNEPRKYYISEEAKLKKKTNPNHPFI